MAEHRKTTEHYVKVYTVFNRLWHWSQVTLIFLLLFTGLRIAGLHTLIKYPLAVTLHTFGALALLTLWLFAVFWLMTTGMWRQFVPTLTGMGQVIQFYAWGVFKGESHPFRKQFRRRLNPLQAASYAGLKLVLFPGIWITGIIYLAHNFWAPLDRSALWLTIVANLHLLAAFGIATFVVVHVYMLTIGHGFREHIRPMLTGFDRVDLTPEEEAYLRQAEPARLRDSAPHS